MAYSKFTNADLKEKFGIRISYEENLFVNAAPRKPSDFLLETLKRNLDLALMQGTEKARSELIISPVFVELRDHADKKISIFSGIEFNVDKKLGLWGRADFLVSKSDYQVVLEAPIVVAIEAKEQDFDGGLTQCAAEMQAAKMFNEQHNTVSEKIYGCVTTGDIWKFLILENGQVKMDTASLDVREDLERILGILYAMAMERF